MDTTLIHADVFFFVSTVLLTVFAVFFIVAIVYVITILREVRRIARLTRRESERIAADIDIVRERVRKGGLTPHAVFTLASGLWKKRKKRNSK